MIGNTGTKPEVINQLTQNLTRKSPFDKVPNDGQRFNVISIDMGIRNFSYTRLELDKSLPFNTPPLVSKWAKFDVNEWAGVDGEHSTDPELYSKISYKLVEEIIFNCAYSAPDIVLIERQRARTGGSSNILEWVFRVNMLESMLHSLIYAKRMNEGLLDGTTVFSTSAQRMGSFWDPTHTELSKGSKKAKPITTLPKTQADTKGFRLKLVEQWLIQHEKNPANRRLSFPGKLDLPPIEDKKRTNTSKWIYELVSTNPAFGLTSRNINGSKKDKAVEKGDDLADCLLHGFTWLEWERHKRVFNHAVSRLGEDTTEKVKKMYYEHVGELKNLADKIQSDPEKIEPKIKEPRKPAKKAKISSIKQTTSEKRI